MTVASGQSALPLPHRKLSNGKDSMVINLAEIGNPSFTVSSPTSPSPSPVAADETGTELLGWIASTPLLAALLLFLNGELLSVLQVNGPQTYVTMPKLILSFVWYLSFLSIESALQWSPTFQRLLSASRDESTANIIEKAREADTVRVETQMTCLRHANGRVGSEVAWTGMSKFACGFVTDASAIPDDTVDRGAVLLEFTSQMNFVDAKSRADYEKHVAAFEAENMARGDTYDVKHVLVIPGVDGKQKLAYKTPKQPPLCASLHGFTIASILGLTILYRLLMKKVAPARRVAIVKSISTSWSRSSPQVDSDKYPSIDYGA